MFSITSFSGKILHISVRHYTADQYGFIAEESKCWTVLPTTQPSQQLKTFRAWNQKCNKKSQDCWAARILHRTRMGKHPLPKVQQSVSSDAKRQQTTFLRLDLFHNFKHLIPFIVWIKSGFMRFANHCFLFLKSRFTQQSCCVCYSKIQAYF